jgi:hypothetical protein
MSRAGRLLLAEGLVTQEQLGEAARQQSLNGGTIGLHLVRAGVIREGMLTTVLCAKLELPLVTDDELQRITPEVAALLPRDVAVISRVVPLEVHEAPWLSVAMSDPTDDRTVAEAARITGCKLRLKVAPESELSLTLERLYGTSRPADLAEWNEGRETRPTAAPATEGDDEDAFKEPEPSTARRYRAPVVLEGRYEMISPDELPPDAEAGYIPLTQVKKRPPGTRSSEKVIQVKSVAIGPGVVTDAEGSGGVPPLTTESLERIAQHISALGGSEHEPAGQPGAARAGERAGSGRGPAAGTDESWDIDDARASSELSIIDAPPPAPRKTPAPRRADRTADARDTLIDLPKVDASHWTGSTANPLGEFVRGIGRAESRDEAVQVSLSFMAAYCRRSAFFVVKRGVVEGFDALSPTLSLEQVRSIWIPLSSRSSLCEAVASKSIRIGPIGDTRVDAIFCAALGGRKGDSIIVPIVIASRVVAVLYGDDLRDSPPPLADIESVAAALGTALSRVVVQDKKRGAP